MATSAFEESTFVLASCLANGLGALCGYSYSGDATSATSAASASSLGSLRSSGYSSYSRSSSSSGSSDGEHCTSCDGGGGSVATRCTTCGEVLCDVCASMHRGSRVTRDHILVRLDGAVPFLGSISVPPPARAPGHHDLGHRPRGPPPRPLQQAPLPPWLLSTRLATQQYLDDAANGMHGVREDIKATTKMIESVDDKAKQVVGEIRQAARRLVAAVEGRERELVAQVERVRTTKAKSLALQADALRSLLARFTRLSESLRDTLQLGAALDILHAKEKAAVELAQLRVARGVTRGPPTPHEDDVVTFAPPDSVVLRVLSSMGTVSSSAYALSTVASGEGLTRAVKGRPAVFTVQVKSHLNETVTGDGLAELLDAALVTPDGGVVRAEVEDRRDGRFLVAYTARAEGGHSLHVTLRGRHIVGSPFQVTVRPVRAAHSSRTTSPTMPPPYGAVRQVTLAFGSEGDADGHFLRPWGICCDRQGRLIVADRSNNRVQVFKADGTLLFKFGSHGSGPGQFDRPAGIASDSRGRIIVADKDNHRVQIFSQDGQFMLTFGEMGSRNGQFHYPWDLDVNAAGQIVVSDTRNHRIQLFSSEGVFITKYGWENSATMWKHFDTPRGVCFHPAGFVLVTDFNNHRLVVVEPSFKNARFLGCEGGGLNQFQRPQGIAVDAEGRIIVADSRNNRLQIFLANGTFITQIGSPSIDLDRPSGVCVTPDGMIGVVDFGHNRVLLL